MGAVLNNVYRMVDEIDFKGQQSQDLWSMVIYFVSAIVSMAVGWFTQDFSHTIYGMLGGLAFVILVRYKQSVSRFSSLAGLAGSGTPSFGTTRNLKS